MPVTTSDKMLQRAQAQGYAIGAFNVENMEMVQGVLAAAEELHAPVIVQTTPGTLRYAPPALFYANILAAAQDASVDVAIHLDHGSSYALVSQALRSGYTSVMIDGSKLPLEENIGLTRRVVEMCAPNHVPVEGELGHIGGKEDDTEDADDGYTRPNEAVRFVEETGISSLAVGIGTAHGVYAAEPKLNVELLSALKQVIPVPLVLHGASGLSREAVRDCIGRGICKVNFATELRIAYTLAVKEFLSLVPQSVDPKQYGGAARDAVRDLVKERIRVCGCEGKA